jgi:hypothetical protein
VVEQAARGDGEVRRDLRWVAVHAREGGEFVGEGQPRGTAWCLVRKIRSTEASTTLHRLAEVIFHAQIPHFIC